MFSRRLPGDGEDNGSDCLLLSSLMNGTLKVESHISSSAPPQLLLSSSSSPPRLLLSSSSSPPHLLLISSSSPPQLLLISSSAPPQLLLISSSAPPHLLLISSSAPAQLLLISLGRAQTQIHSVVTLFCSLSPWSIEKFPACEHGVINVIRGLLTKPQKQLAFGLLEAALHTTWCTAGHVPTCISSEYLHVRAVSAVNIKTSRALVFHLAIDLHVRR